LLARSFERRKKVKVALVYDRINKWGGAERVLLALHEIFPNAPLYCAVADIQKAPWAKIFPRIYPSFIQKIPIFRNFHELLGWLTPIAFEQFNFDNYDLVVSVSSEAAKGVIVKPKTKHVSICLTPTRYLWSQKRFYYKKPQWPLSLIPFYKFFSKPFLNYAKYWDKIASKRADVVIAISNDVKKRIKKYYKRDSVVIYPPVNVDYFNPVQKTKKENVKKLDYLVVSRLVPYKKVKLAVEAFNRIGRKLVVIGDGSEKKNLKKIAYKNIEFVGIVSDMKLKKYYQLARALIMPQNEDFGIASVEAQSCGTPVIAYMKGGSCDTVVDGKTGVLFNKQTIDTLVDAVKRFDRMDFKTNDLVNNAKRFGSRNFEEKFLELINKT